MSELDLNFVAENRNRRYAKQIGSGGARRKTLSFRVNESVKQQILVVAARRLMSPSEYLCRLLNDHLAQMERLTA